MGTARGGEPNVLVRCPATHGLGALPVSRFIVQVVGAQAFANRGRQQARRDAN